MQVNEEAKLKQIIAGKSRLNVSADEITEKTNLITELAFDSIQLLALISEIEEEFDVLIDPDSLNMETLSTYKGIKQCLEKNTA
jgi:acyl carrier protein